SAAICRLVAPFTVGCGWARSHSPVVAVSVPLGLRVQPWSLVKSSEKTTLPLLGAFTCRLRVAAWLMAPLVPVTWKVEAPVAASAATETTSELVADPPAAGVTEAGLKLQVTPAAVPVQARLTALEKPLSDPTVQVLVALPPWVAVRLAGLQARVKSATGAGLIWRLMVADRVRAPLVPLTWKEVGPVAA